MCLAPWLHHVHKTGSHVTLQRVSAQSAVKRHFMRVNNLMQISQIDLLKNLRAFYLCFMHYNDKKLCDTNLCDQLA